jgi:hypothetical protein
MPVARKVWQQVEEGSPASSARRFTIRNTSVPRQLVREGSKPAAGLRYSGNMDINKMLAEIRQERDQLDEAIAVLERLAAGQGKRRGRPPRWMKLALKRPGRPPGSKNKPKLDD